MRRAITVLVLSSLILPPMAAWASPGEAVATGSRITAVTVYPDRALVTRTAITRVEPGQHRARFDDLPGGLVDESLRVGATGKARILGVEIIRAHLAAPDDARIRDLEAEIRQLEEADRSLADEIEVSKAQQRFLQAIQVKAADHATKEITLDKLNVDGWRQALAFVVGGLEAANARIRAAEEGRRDLQEKLRALRKDLQQVRSPRPLERKAAIVTLAAEAADPFELTLSYVVPGAGWSPVYVARTLLDARAVELASLGQVRQQTGEDWEDVELKLSTARPALGARPPDLPSWVLRFLGLPRAASASGLQAGELKEEGRRDVPATEEPDQATLIKTGTAVAFRAMGRASIPSDGRGHRTALAVQRLAGDFRHTSVPKMVEAVYVAANVRNSGEYPLLPGPLEVFMGSEYVGSTTLALVAPGESFDLPAGVDEGIRVKRQLVKRERSTAGLFAKHNRVSFVYRITLENFRGTAETVRVQDHLPVSQDADIQVTGIRLAPEPVERDERGILTWEIPLKPREKREVTIEYAVEFPQGKEVPGL